jgi:hypothetical protein
MLKVNRLARLSESLQRYDSYFWIERAQHAQYLSAAAVVKVEVNDCVRWWRPPGDRETHSRIARDVRVKATRLERTR